MPRDISYYQQQIERIKQIKRQKDIASGKIPAPPPPITGINSNLEIQRGGGSPFVRQPSPWGSPVSAKNINQTLGIDPNRSYDIVDHKGIVYNNNPTAKTMSVEDYLRQRPSGPNNNPVTQDFVTEQDDIDRRKKAEHKARTQREKRRQKKRERHKRHSGRRNRSKRRGRGPQGLEKLNVGSMFDDMFDDMFKLKLSGRAKAGIGLGALAITGMGALALKSQSYGLSQANPISFSRNMKPEDVAASTFWQRQTAIAGAGYLNARMGGDMGAGGALAAYAKGRFMDNYNVMFNSPLSDGGLSPGMTAGAAVGGGMSVMAASAIRGFSKGGFKGKGGIIGGIGTVLAAGAIGAGIGGYQGSKVDIGLSRAIQTARKNILGQGRRMSNRAHTMGRGYRMWASPRGRRRMGQPGHLGMDGSMAFAMHNARNRSTV